MRVFQKRILHFINFFANGLIKLQQDELTIEEIKNWKKKWIKIALHNPAKWLVQIVSGLIWSMSVFYVAIILHIFPFLYYSFPMESDFPSLSILLYNYNCILSPFYLLKSRFTPYYFDIFSCCV